ncbi:DsbA family protein [Porphyrobacter sp. ULC335]|uniref:DsbA family protein n=1 Tax=Porphyrobacter sp. ULC335 TaxID=2854260 RepID=UPI002220F6B8|nr:DsbA family protein [Porphyrobacter sp. ULC335]UYV15251.1 DsbA family protein [Porphyrobacter sp. ULC335]
MTVTRLFSLPLLALAPLMLAACDDAATADGAASGEALPAIAAPAGTKWADTVTVTPEGGYMIGNPDAPIKLVEYASHTCGHCADFAKTGKPTLKDKYVASGVVSFEQREAFLNPFDVVIAGLAQCGAKEQFQPLSDQVWGNLESVFAGLQGNPQAVQAASALPLNQRFVAIGEATGLIEFFAARGLSADQARSCLADTAKIEALVKTVEANNDKDKIAGTPTFFLNGKKIEGTTWEVVEPALQRAGAR